VLLLVTDANQRRKSLLGHPDEDALHSNPLPHMPVDIGRSDALRHSLIGSGVVGRSIFGVRLEGCPVQQSCRRYRRGARSHRSLAPQRTDPRLPDPKVGRILFESVSILP
jgi:hypothetical protein